MCVCVCAVVCGGIRKRRMSLRDMLFGSGAATACGDADPNVVFYRNQLASEPQGALVEDIHKNWDGNFELLEMHHGYVRARIPAS
jgi:hypothetical protein